MVSRDRSNGYEAVAGEFMARRGGVGAGTVRRWASALVPGAAVLDLGCGHGVPITQVLMDEGFGVHGIDASPTLIAAFRDRFPAVPAECAAVEESAFFGRTFDGVVAWGLIFLLPADTQTALVRKVTRILNRGGRFLFTSPQAACTWPDAQTGQPSISLGSEVYRRILATVGLEHVGEASDEGDNHYHFAHKR